MDLTTDLEATGLKQRLIVCMLAVAEWLVSNVATGISVCTYKFRPANKTLPSLRVFVPRNPWHPFAEPSLRNIGLWNITVHHRVLTSANHWYLLWVKLICFTHSWYFLKFRCNTILLPIHRSSHRVLSFWVSDQQTIWKFRIFLACYITSVSFSSIWSVCKTSKCYEAPHYLVISGQLYRNIHRSRYSRRNPVLTERNVVMFCFGKTMWDSTGKQKWTW